MEVGIFFVFLGLSMRVIAWCVRLAAMEGG